MRAISTLLLCLFAVKAAADQPEPSRAILLPFTNLAGPKGEAPRTVAEEVVTERLSAGKRYILLPAEETRRALQARRIKSPYNLAEMCALAGELKAESVITGEIAFVRTVGGHTAVGLRVYVYDSRSKDLMNGAVEVGYSILGSTAAARDAGGRAASNTLLNAPVTGIILPSTTALDLLALVNRGSEEGLFVGAMLRVWRDNEPVGMLKVTNVSPTYSEAKVVDIGKGFRPPDEVRLIFKMPPFPKLVFPPRPVPNAIERPERWPGMWD